MGTINPLSSVLKTTNKSSTIQLLHRSLRDFLIDQRRSTNRFHIIEAEAHRELLSCCLKVLRNDTLIEDNCDFMGLKSSISRQLLTKYEHVNYACRYWATCGTADSVFWTMMMFIYFSEIALYIGWRLCV